MRVAAARVRLNAITAQTSQAAFAQNFPDGRCASADTFRSAWTCSMIACPRWVLSAAAVSRVLVVKNAWKRHVWNNVSWPSRWLRSGIRRTTSRPGIWSACLFDVNAVNGDLGDLSPGNPLLSRLVEDGVGVGDGRPGVVADLGDGRLDPLVEADRHRHVRAALDGGGHGGVAVERRRGPQQTARLPRCRSPRLEGVRDQPRCASR